MRTSWFGTRLERARRFFTRSSRAEDDGIRGKHSTEIAPKHDRGSSWTIRLIGALSGFCGGSEQARVEKSFPQDRRRSTRNGEGTEKKASVDARIDEKIEWVPTRNKGIRARFISKKRRD